MNETRSVPRCANPACVICCLLTDGQLSAQRADAQARWRAGRCPCCGMPLEPWEWKGTITPPEPIAESVMLCGRCIANDHHADPPQARRHLLMLLVPVPAEVPR